MASFVDRVMAKRSRMDSGITVAPTTASWTSAPGDVWAASTAVTTPTQCCSFTALTDVSMLPTMVNSTCSTFSTIGAPMSPPTSPRRPAANSPPPAHRAGLDSPLLKALRKRSVEKTSQALFKDPDAAWMPILEYGFAPPLCCAVRLGCGGDIVRLLLDHRAEVDASDVHGLTPLAILSSIPCSTPRSAVVEALDGFGQMMGDADALISPAANNRHIHHANTKSLEIAAVLLKAGAIASEPVGERDNTSCIDLAMAAGNAHLVQLFIGDTM